MPEQRPRAPSVRFTADFFNLFNHPNYQNPSVKTAAITALANDPRLIQFGARLEF